MYFTEGSKICGALCFAPKWYNGFNALVNKYVQQNVYIRFKKLTHYSLLQVCLAATKSAEKLMDFVHVNYIRVPCFQLFSNSEAGDNIFAFFVFQKVAVC
jgi:hypothetical protein